MQNSYRFFFALLCTIAFYFDQSGITAALLIAAGLHESGHVLASLLTGCKIERLEFSAFGVAMEKEEKSSVREAIITAAGPLVNLACWYIYGVYYPHSPFSDYFIQANLLLALVNLLPACPLDGWRLMRLLLLRFLPFNTAERVGFWVSILSVGIASTLGFYLLLTYKNLSMLAFCTYLIVYLIRQSE